jgi:hypothetical protein
VKRTRARPIVAPKGPGAISAAATLSAENAVGGDTRLAAAPPALPRSGATSIPAPAQAPPAVPARLAKDEGHEENFEDVGAAPIFKKPPPRDLLASLPRMGVFQLSSTIVETVTARAAPPKPPRARK